METPTSTMMTSTSLSLVHWPPSFMVRSRVSVVITLSTGVLGQVSLLSAPSSPAINNSIEIENFQFDEIEINRQKRQQQQQPTTKETRPALSACRMVVGVWWSQQAVVLYCSPAG